MSQEFERTRVDVEGRGITITSWYEADKQRWRANAPAFLHILGGCDDEDGRSTGATRERAIRAVCERLIERFHTPTPEPRHR